DLLVCSGDWAHQVVTAGRYESQTEPRVPRDQALEVLGRHDIQIVLTYDGTDEFRVLLHYEGREVELALCHEFGLFGQFMVGQMNIQLPQVGVRQELLHEIRGARALRADPDGCPAKIGKGVKATAGSTEQQQRLRRRESA